MKLAYNGGKILITGGGGFIGANLTRKLLDLNYEVHILWKKDSDPWRLQDIKNKIHFHTVDIGDLKKLTLLLKKVNPTAIYHLATYSSYRNQEDVKNIYEVSVNGTLNLLLASRDIPYKIFVNTGSSSEYGFKNDPMKEDDLLEPVSFYASAKSAQTLLCQTFSYHYKKNIVTIRPFSVYGPYEQKDRFIPVIARSLINDKPIKITSGNQRRDFIYIDDIIDIYIKTISCADRISGKILNAGTGIEYSNDEIVKALFKVTGKKVLVEKGKFAKRIWDSPHWVADIKNVKRELNWKPGFSLEKGLGNTYDWFLKNENLYEAS